MVNLIKQARESRGWTSARLNAALRDAAQATRTPIASQTSLRVMISAWENGRQVPDSTYRRLLQSVFGLPAEALGFIDDADREQVGQLSSLVCRNANRIEMTDGVLAYFRHQLAEHVKLDRISGPGLILEIVEAQAVQLRRLSEKDPDRVAELTARYLELAGWLRQDSGDFTCALRLTNDSIDMSGRAGLPDLAAYGTMRKSNILSGHGDFDSAGFMARRAVEMAQRGAPEHIAVCLRQLAIVEAHLNNEANARDALETALAEAGHGSGPAGSGLASYCTVSYLEMENAACLLALGEPSSAVDACSRALDSWPEGQVRDRALCLARLAAARLEVNDVDAACSAAVTAVEQVRAAPSARTLGGLRLLSRRLQPFQASPHVRWFRDALATVA